MASKKTSVVPVQPVGIAHVLQKVSIPREQALIQAIAKLNTTYGPGTIQFLRDIPPRPKVATGIDGLDQLLQGGIETGGVIQIAGKEGSGRTSLALQIASKYPSILWIDGEGKMSVERAALFGCHENFLLAAPDELVFEDALEIARFFLMMDYKIVVIDSVPSIPCRKDAEEKDFSKTTVAPHAAILAKRLPILAGLCSKHNSTLLMINQIRDSVGMFSPNPNAEKVHRFGGHQLEAMSKAIVMTARKSDLKHPKLGTYGIEVAYRLDKCSYAPSRKANAINLVERRGFVPVDQLATVRSELLAEMGAKDDDIQGESFQDEVIEGEQVVEITEEMEP